MTFTPPDRDRRGPGVASSPLPGLGTDWGGLGPCPQGPSHLQVLKLLLLLLEHLKLLQHRVLRELPPLQLPKDTAGTGGCVAAPLSPPVPSPVLCSPLPSHPEISPTSHIKGHAQGCPGGWCQRRVAAQKPHHFPG